ncbi:1-deoxy-D-xylulose-5-phosphate synthase [Blastococcus sp. MG754426]|uniref:1-deoxy-D-xylulose-5-phosphate synthase n=1 Tax=unclassified Blastococcus TaxID=2619396 RepID=UPI001EF1208A|nr:MULTISPECIES: 1-deoxy-D-xylulose-5-phosphate synthase [unclassified Blastococcus]MCF6506350.1 1-deoxy-D-xylulose-5-phosphate synthase [Blastococcus sp. MG754426]MCF6510834.1 1-deoxy-D-xylulose-5-phosphate synthase [Blastococcus sp. MG754427]MCF6733802.1 1-deoxy-D-xylulose-5-phosphate synthase [Blastococcus sp. KM273129]
MPLLRSLRGPEDVRALESEALPALAAEIRDALVTSVARTGGHLGPNLGCVELTIALHRVFDSPREPIVFDTGHQSYVHKMLTGRVDGFERLRQRGGLSGYPSRAESDHDWVENSHASTSLSYADGLAKAFAIRGDSRPVVAVIGDGALTGGMAWEALNNIAAAQDRPVVIVVNDNGRSYSPTIGGVADALATLRLRPGYENALLQVRQALHRAPVVGSALYDALHAIKKGLKDVLSPQGMFEDLGLKYVGPVDGHDIRAVESALRRARSFGGPVIVHAVTTKGFGYPPAETDQIDAWHATGVFDPDSGASARKTGLAWTDAFADELVRVGAERPDVVAITAAMLHPTGLAPFAERFPERTFDVGIAEQHALTSAAGLAMAGLHPVVAVYSTFLNRAFDQLLMDVALHRQPVTVVLDRAGVTGDDGASHNGMWDMSILSVVPGLALAAPRDEATLREALREAVDITDGPSVVRFPKGSLPPDIPAVERRGPVDVLRRGARAEVLLVAVGSMVPMCQAVAERAADHGIEVTVVDPRWVLPVSAELVELAAGHRLVVTVEDGGRAGGVGTTLSQALQDRDVDVPVRTLGLPQQFFEHGSRGQVLADAGLTEQDVARRIAEWTARLTERAGDGVTEAAVEDRA